MYNFDNVLETTKKTYWTNLMKYIVLHHTWNTNYKGNCNYLSGKPGLLNKVSCHFVVWQKGEACKIWQPTDVLHHMWTWNYKWITNMNFHALWIEVCWPKFTKVQYDKVTDLVKYLMKTFKIPATNIIRHADYTKRKVDISNDFFIVWGLKGIEQYRKFIINK